MVHMFINVNGKRTPLPAKDAVRIGHEDITSMAERLIADIQKDAVHLALTLKLDECSNYFVSTGDTMIKATVERWEESLHVELYVCTIDRFASFQLN